MSIQHLNEDRKKLFADIYLPSQDHFVYQDTTSNYEKLEELLPTFFKSTELKAIWRAVSSNEAEYEKTKGLLESQKGDTILIVRNFDGLKEAIHEETKFSDSKDSSINLFWTKNKEQRKKLTQFQEKTKQEAFRAVIDWVPTKGVTMDNPTHLVYLRNIGITMIIHFYNHLKKTLEHTETNCRIAELDLEVCLHAVFVIEKSSEYLKRSNANDPVGLAIKRLEKNIRKDEDQNLLYLYGEAGRFLQYNN